MAGSQEVLDSWGNAKWKEGQAAPVSAEETTQLLKGECEGLEWNEPSCRIYHSDCEIKGVRLFRGFRWGNSRIGSRRKTGKEGGEVVGGKGGRGGVEMDGELRAVWKPASVRTECARFPPLATNLLYDFEQVISPFCPMK